jgi:hypothetical protein
MPGLMGKMLKPIPDIADSPIPRPVLPAPPAIGGAGPFPHLQNRIGNIQGMLASGLNRAGNPMQRPEMWQNRLGMLQNRLQQRMLPPGLETPHVL